MNPAEVVVIGGGSIGVCSAYFLAAAGREVTLIEKGEIASGCSYGNGGLLCPSHSVPLASPGILDKLHAGDDRSPISIPTNPGAELSAWLSKFRAAATEEQSRRNAYVMRDLLTASLALHRELAALSEAKYGFEQHGSLTLCRSQAAYDELRSEADELAGLGIESTELSGAETAALEPAVTPDITGAVHFLGDAQFIPADFVRAIAGEAAKLGAKICTSTEVLELEASPSGISAVSTTRGDFQPDVVVLAGGSWSPVLARKLDIDLPIQAAKGYSITIAPKGRGPKIPLSLREAKAVVMPMGNAVRFAGTLEFAGLDLSYNLRRANSIREAAGAYTVDVTEGELIEVWRGLRPCSPDGLPFVGRHDRLQNLIVAAGHATLGMSLGPVTGKLVSQIVSGETADFDLAPLRLNRFQ
jgi:D-amino-acid dehydrogenase